MAILELVPNSEKPRFDVSEILEWLDRSKECVKEYEVTSIAIAWTDREGRTGSGYIANNPAPLLGALELIKREILDREFE